MADSNLNQPVIIQATRIDATSLPPGFSMALKQYLIQQGQDFGKVVDRANEAGQGAFDAQKKNEEQDVTLGNHEQRIFASEKTIVDHEKRISSAEKAVADHEKRISANETELADHEQRIVKNALDINNISKDYVSKTFTAQQSISSPLNVTTSLSVNGTKVVGSRVTGFTAITGSGYFQSFNADTLQAFSATYQQSELASLAQLVQTARRRIKALDDALRAHGLID